MDRDSILKLLNRDKGFLVIATGISHCGGKTIFLPAFEKLCKKKGVNVLILNVGDMMFDWACQKAGVFLPTETVLYREDEGLALAQAGACQSILVNLEKYLQKYDVVIVNLHTDFLWYDGTVVIPVNNESTFLTQLCDMHIQPDTIITFIDNAMDIRSRLDKSDQWGGQNHSEKDIWKWQNTEVNNTERYLHWFHWFFKTRDIRFFTIPVRQPVETLYRTLFEPWAPVFYAQVPISHIKAVKLKKHKKFIDELRQAGSIVYDPLTIETGIVVVESADDIEIQVQHYQTGFRDTRWFIPQCDYALANYVEPVMTMGVPDETATASSRGKKTWIIFDGGRSPFADLRASKIFQNTDECLKYFIEIESPRIHAKWEEKTECKVQEYKFY